MNPATAGARFAVAAFLLSWPAGAGASGMPFLLLGSGARATALGDAAAALADIDAAAANPAAVSAAGGRLGGDARQLASGHPARVRNRPAAVGSRGSVGPAVAFSRRRTGAPRGTQPRTAR